MAVLHVISRQQTLRKKIARALYNDQHVPYSVNSLIVESANMDNPEQFDWNERRAVVVKRVDPIAIYVDSEGDIIIRQQHAHSPADCVITIPAVHAQSVIEGLQRHIRGRFAASLMAAATG